MTLSSRGPGHRPFTAVTRVRIPLGSPHILSRTRDLLLRTRYHLLPLGQPAYRAWNGKQHREHRGIETHRLVNDPRVEIHVWVELPLDEVFSTIRSSSKAMSSLGFLPV